MRLIDAFRQHGRSGSGSAVSVVYMWLPVGGAPQCSEGHKGYTAILALNGVRQCHFPITDTALHHCTGLAFSIFHCGTAACHPSRSTKTVRPSWSPTGRHPHQMPLPQRLCRVHSVLSVLPLTPTAPNHPSQRAAWPSKSGLGRTAPPHFQLHLGDEAFP